MRYLSKYFDGRGRSRKWVRRRHGYPYGKAAIEIDAALDDASDAWFNELMYGSVGVDPAKSGQDFSGIMHWIKEK